MLKYKANTELKDKNGKTPLMIANEMGKFQFQNKTKRTLFDKLIQQKHDTFTFPDRTDIEYLIKNGKRRQKPKFGTLLNMMRAR